MLVDEIIVLDRGNVVQRGTHRELIRADGPYRQMLAARPPGGGPPMRPGPAEVA